MQLHTLKGNAGARKDSRSKRVGRGNGSGRGNYSGRGGKGQTARTGGKIPAGFEGGQTPLYRRMPKLGGFQNPNRIEYAIVNVGDCDRLFKEGETVDAASLIKKGLIRGRNRAVKILGEGELKIALKFKVAKISKSAAKKIAESKGEISPA